MEHANSERSFWCSLVLAFVFGIFWAYYTFADPDGGSKCYGRQVYSPLSDEYVVQVSTKPWPVEEDNNIDISKSFHVWFYWGFI